jgi:RHS repeat-associated protein
MSADEAVNADQRYYASGYGRFNTPDTGPANPGSPGTRNRYAYVGGDPINRRDPKGTCWISADGNEIEDGTVTDIDALWGYGYQPSGGSYSITVTDSAPELEPNPCQGTDAGCAPTSIESPEPNGPLTQGGGGGAPIVNIANFTTMGTQALIVRLCARICKTDHSTRLSEEQGIRS